MQKDFNVAEMGGIEDFAGEIQIMILLLIPGEIGTAREAMIGKLPENGFEAIQGIVVKFAAIAEVIEQAQRRMGIINMRQHEIPGIINGMVGDCPQIVEYESDDAALKLFHIAQ